MTNAELITALRYCSDNEKEDGCDECPYLHNGMCRTMLSDAAYALEAADKRIAELENQEPTEKQVVDYCHKRCLVIVEVELFQRMKATFSKLPKEGEWLDETDGRYFWHGKCSICNHEYNIDSYYGDMKYCPNCGAKMDGADGERRTE